MQYSQKKFVDGFVRFWSSDKGRCVGIRNQWLLFQNGQLPEHWYWNTNDQQPLLSNQNSYWKRLEEESGLSATANSKSIYKRLNCLWIHIQKIRDDQGSLKYNFLWKWDNSSIIYKAFGIKRHKICRKNSIKP